MSTVDLHVHSTASDGRLTPREVIYKAEERGLTVIAITDHDTVDGIAPALAAARDFPALRLIPALEINTDIPHGEAHILGYFIDYTNPELLDTLKRLRFSRQRRAQGMVEKLKTLGLQLDWQRVQEIAGDSTIGRPHIAQAMLEKGYIRSFQDAFINYIGRNGPAYVEREKINQVDAVKLILQANGLPVLGHPSTIADPEATVIDLKAVGLVGIEAYYKEYTHEEVNRLLNLARRHGLIATGGTDYHGIDESNEVMIGGTYVPVEAAEKLIALAGQPPLK